MVAPPGHLKTTIVNSLQTFPDALCLSDINIKSLALIRDDIMGGRFRTLAFGEMEKLYARNPNVASNIEAHLRQFVEEGMRNLSFEDSRMALRPGRCLVVAGMTPSMYGRRLSNWEANGFARRFLRLNWNLSNESLIMDAIDRWRKLELSRTIVLSWNGKAHMRYNLDEKESHMIRTLLKDQLHSTPFVLMKKTACVLKTKLPKEWSKVMQDVAEGLRRDGALLTV